MRIVIKAKPGAKVASVTKAKDIDAGKLFSYKTKTAPSKVEFVVAVKEPAKEGRANRAIEKALAEYLNVAPSRVRIVSGHSAKEKIVEVL